MSFERLNRAEGNVEIQAPSRFPGSPLGLRLEVEVGVSEPQQPSPDGTSFGLDDGGNSALVQDFA